MVGTLSQRRRTLIRELLRGDIIEKMAPAVAERWPRLSENIETSADLVESLELEYGVHYESLNSLIVLWGWRMIAIEWLAAQSMPLLVRDSFLKQTDTMFRGSSERWILLSHWSGRWRSAGGNTFESYLKDLGGLWESIHSLTSSDLVVKALSEQMAAWIEALRPAAQKYIDDLAVENRSEVQRYFVPLWVWHRLDSTRWEQSRVQLRIGKKKVSLDVDHIVSCKWWEGNIAQVAEEQSLAVDDERLAGTPPSEGPKEEMLDQGSLNDLGNCFLLWRSFNISKSDRSLKSFLAQVYEFKDASRLATWKQALLVTDAQFDPDASEDSAIRAAIAVRTKLMKEDLRKFVAGSALPAHDKPAFDVSGRWGATSNYDSGQQESFEMVLAQTENRIVGTYTGDGRIEGELEGVQFEGRWSDGGRHGTVFGLFDESGRVFAAHWRYYRGRKLGNWSAQRLEP